MNEGSGGQKQAKMINISSRDVQLLQQIFQSQQAVNKGGLQLVKGTEILTKAKSGKDSIGENMWLQRPPTAVLSTIEQNNLKWFRELDLIAYQQDQKYLHFIKRY